MKKRGWKLSRSNRIWAKTPGLNDPPFIARQYDRCIRRKLAKYKWQRTNIREEMRMGGSGWKSIAEFWRAIKHPRLWWDNMYWIGKGGTNRKSELKTRLRYETTYWYSHSRPRWAINLRR